MNEKNTLRIKAENLGNIEDIIKLLTDLEFAYNSLYVFNYVIDSIEAERQRNITSLDERLRYLNEIRKEFRGLRYSEFFLVEFLERFAKRDTKSIDVIELQNKLKSKDLLLPEDKLQISKINIQSPGFWEILGSSNVVKEIRLFLKDRHERKKDQAFRNKQQETRGNIQLLKEREELIQQRIDTLKRAGYNEAEIRILISKFITQPLDRLGEHQNSGLIEGPEE